MNLSAEPLALTGGWHIHQIYSHILVVGCGVCLDSGCWIVIPSVWILSLSLPEYIHTHPEYWQQDRMDISCEKREKESLFSFVQNKVRRIFDSNHQYAGYHTTNRTYGHQHWNFKNILLLLIPLKIHLRLIGNLWKSILYFPYIKLEILFYFSFQSFFSSLLWKDPTVLKSKCVY